MGQLKTPFASEETHNKPICPDYADDCGTADSQNAYAETLKILNVKLELNPQFPWKLAGLSLFSRCYGMPVKFIGLVRLAFADDQAVLFEQAEDFIRIMRLPFEEACLCLSDDFFGQGQKMSQLRFGFQHAHQQVRVHPQFTGLELFQHRAGLPGQAPR